MKNVSKIGRRMWFNLLFVLPLFGTPAAPVFIEPTPSAACTCTAPNYSITSHSSDAVSFSWSAVPGATVYKVWYYRHEDHFTSSEYTTGQTDISFSNLPAGTYDFYFVTVCGGESSGYIIEDDLLMG